MKSIAKSELAFHGVKFNPVDHAGQIWLTSTELSKSLDYSNIRAVTGIYNRHADEFTSSMTLVLKLNTKGFGGGNSQRDVRVFSLRGAHLVAMLSNTPIAKEFRKWVLDILDTQIEVQAKKSRQSTATQLIPLRQTAERLITTGIGKIYPDIWKLVHERFDVEHIHQLQPAQIKEAVAYLDGLEGEFIGKQSALPVPSFDFQMYVHNVNVACIHMEKVCEAWIDELRPSLKAMESPLAARLNDRIMDATAIIGGIRRALEKASGLKGLQYREH
ncbi:hypothetical protein H4F47_10540 [Pectobacterium brasiliense]|uniref:BRO-N domain-containing protein n=1 Tax=Pectobacterium brasiliense TaxID=180957 RepID=UPI0019693CE2|nr:BRO family protein [Pectobacterium brasiliense]MBN3043356.1 hypothetical protein [Pectobacterium brasiliense]